MEYLTRMFKYLGYNKWELIDETPTPLVDKERKLSWIQNDSLNPNLKYRCVYCNFKIQQSVVNDTYQGNLDRVKCDC